jgi:hypothetical protein
MARNTRKLKPKTKIIQKKKSNNNSFPLITTAIPFYF